MPGGRGGSLSVVRTSTIMSTSDTNGADCYHGVTVSIDSAEALNGALSSQHGEQMVDLLEQPRAAVLAIISDPG